MKTILRRPVLLIIIGYILVYCFLSANGKYEPSMIGIARVKEVCWAPLGFYDAQHPWPNSLAAKQQKGKTGGWSQFMPALFFPLYVVDIRFIHDEYHPSAVEEPSLTGQPILPPLPTNALSCDGKR